MNGRALTDDVMDHFACLITNGKLTRDNVDPTLICSPNSHTSAVRRERDLPDW